MIGDPVHHSLSPVLHNAAYAALGLDWVYVAFPVPAGEAAEAVAAMRALGLLGLSVTMPHKQAVAAVVDRLSPAARRLGAVNTVTRAGDELWGDNTDGPGFVDALRQDAGFDPSGRRALVLGTGGAARAVALALVERGATVGVAGRRPDAVAACVAVAGEGARAAEVREVADADLIVNATPVGMTRPTRRAEARVAQRRLEGPDLTRASLPLDVDPAWLGAGQLVVDLIYRPAVTPLLAEARRRGADTANGLGMLIHQAARQLTQWTGQPAPLDAMSAAALAALDDG